LLHHFKFNYHWQ